MVKQSGGRARPRGSLPDSPFSAAFRDRVYEIIRLVPDGQVATYGQVAMLAGAPRMARHVGGALHSLPSELVFGVESDVRHQSGGHAALAPTAAPGAGPGAAPHDTFRAAPVGAAASGPHQGGPQTPQDAVPTRVPWHRIINAQGRVSTHPDEYGTWRQIELLRREGISVDDDGKLIGGLATHQWQPDPTLVEALELPAEVIFELDRYTER